MSTSPVVRVTEEHFQNLNGPALLAVIRNESVDDQARLTAVSALLRRGLPEASRPDLSELVSKAREQDKTLDEPAQPEQAQPSAGAPSASYTTVSHETAELQAQNIAKDQELRNLHAQADKDAESKGAIEAQDGVEVPRIKHPLKDGEDPQNTGVVVPAEAAVTSKPVEKAEEKSSGDGNDAGDWTQAEGAGLGYPGPAI